MTWAFSALGGLVVLFIVAPLAGMALKCSGAELARTAAEPEVRRSIFLTLWTSMAATVLFSVAVIPLAWVLARREFRGKGLLLGLVNVPVVIPHSAAGIALLGVLSRNSAAGAAADRLGLGFVGTPAGIMAAMAFVSLPFFINAAYDGFRAVPARLERAAMTLGASPLRVFFTVSLPLAWRPILSGLVMMWARGMSEFGAVVVIAYHPMITPVLIYERFGQFGLQYARPVAVLFIAICLAFFVAFRLIAGGRHAES
jgi:molybdate/tungstate transport system permease protein